MFGIKTRKRAVKYHNKCQSLIAKYTGEQLKYKANQQQYWHWQRLIDEQNVISLAIVKILSNE